MSVRRAALSTLLLLGASPAHAGSVTLPCSLPSVAALTMTEEQNGWSSGGKPWTIILTRHLQIARDAAGSLLTVGAASVTSDLDAEGQRRLAAAFPPSRQPVVLRLSGLGEIVGVQDLAGHWQAYLDRIEQVARNLEAEGKSGERTRATLKALVALDEPARIAIIAEAAGTLLRHCGQSAQGVTRGGLVRIEETSDNGTLVEAGHYEVDARTGLTRSAELRTTIKAQPDRPQVDRWRFEPAS